VTPFKNDEDRDRNLFSLATQLGLMDLSERINAVLPQKEDEKNDSRAVSRPHSPQDDFSRLT
jgi:phage terminase small subunit